MGSCLSAPVPTVDITEEEKARNREIDRQLKEVRLHPPLFLHLNLSLIIPIPSVPGKGKNGLASQGSSSFLSSLYAVRTHIDPPFFNKHRFCFWGPVILENQPSSRSALTLTRLALLFRV